MVELHEERIELILKKLNEVRHKRLTCFGSDKHKFHLNPPLEESALAQCEAEHKVVLPPDFRSFLKLAGNGGAGPYFGIYRLKDSHNLVDLTTDGAVDNPLALPCLLTPAMSRNAGREKCNLPIAFLPTKACCRSAHKAART